MENLIKEIELQRIFLLVIGIVIVLGQIALLWCFVKISKEMLRLHEWNIKILRTEMNVQSNWLFNQLYAMAPGKVLRPDETEEEQAYEPATVYNPNKDPMKLVKGELSDWFIQQD
jgi:hypothetical protein